MRTATIGLLALALIGCSDSEFENPLHPSGSRTLVASSGQDAVHAVNVEEGTVSTFWLANEAVQVVDVGVEPTRIARHGTRVFVTLRGEGALAVLEEVSRDLILQQTIEVGSEPVGVVVNEQGQVFVALSRENEVIGMDAETLEIFGRWPVPNEPRWLAVSPSQTVFVGSLKQGGVYQIDLETDVVTPLEVPTTTALNAVGEVELTTRVTGDPAVSPDGRFLVVPVLQVDNTTTATQAAAAGNDQYYASVTAGPARFNPGAAVFGLDTTGHVVRSLPTLHAVSAVDAVGESAPRVVRSFPSSVTISPDGKDFLLPMEGSRTIVALTEGSVSNNSFLSTGAFIDHAEFERQGFASPPRAAVWTKEGPRSVVYVTPDTAVVHNWLDRSVTAFDPTFTYSETGEDSSAISWSTAIEQSRFDAVTENGRMHFNTAVSDVMQATGAGVSCATCHFDSREDGLSWPLEVGPRQTPTLAGRVSETTPITWAGNVETVAEEVQLTSIGRMGGAGAGFDLADDIATYIDFTRQPVPSAKLDGSAVTRGETLFNREDVGCAECHPAPTYTDGESHRVLGSVSVNTPTLRGLAASAPYFHDGTGSSLDDVLGTAVIGSMGDASMLTEAEIADLKAFLQSL